MSNRRMTTSDDMQVLITFQIKQVKEIYHTIKASLTSVKNISQPVFQTRQTRARGVHDEQIRTCSFTKAK